MNSERFYILDTFRMGRRDNPLLPIHIERTYEAVRVYHPDLNKDDITKMYLPFQITKKDKDQKCRFTVDPQTVELVSSEVTDIDSLNDVIRLEIATHQNQRAGRGLQNYKTSNRKYWDDNLSLKWPGIDDVVGINVNGHITETSRFNLFIKIEDEVFTPTLKSGCVNGCLRRSSLASGFIEINENKYFLKEKDFMYDELKNTEIFVGNSLRGIAKASLDFAHKIS